MSKALRHGLIAVGSALWLAGLASQLHSTATTATYLVLSAALVALAML